MRYEGAIISIQTNLKHFHANVEYIFNDGGQVGRLQAVHEVYTFTRCNLPQTVRISWHTKKYC
jgi:hypothetical protein